MAINGLNMSVLNMKLKTKKTEYYKELRSCQDQRPNEDVTSWVHFFMKTLLQIQESLLAKLATKGTSVQLSPREKSILVYIENHPGCKSGKIAEKLDIPNPTVKGILTDLISKKLIEKFSLGPGTNYSIV